MSGVGTHPGQAQFILLPHALSESIEAVRERLAASGYAELQRIQCQLESGRIILRGTVSSYYLLQLALHEVKQIVGSVEIESHIEVARL